MNKEIGSCLEDQGYEIINGIYTESEVNTMLEIIDRDGYNKAFGVRSFLKSTPDLYPIVYNDSLRSLIINITPKAQIVRSIYFDKPPSSNWVVQWHQDLTINVNNRVNASGFKNWRVLDDRVVVQPPLAILENMITVRIHLDECTSSNGALKVLANSHKRGVIDMKKGIGDLQKKEVICEVDKGGILLMKPLTPHASRRTENTRSRRVIHIEFCDASLPDGLEWAEGRVLE